jgi:hypothetical protein
MSTVEELAQQLAAERAALGILEVMIATMPDDMQEHIEGATTSLLGLFETAPAVASFVIMQATHRDRVRRLAAEIEDRCNG